MSENEVQAPARVHDDVIAAYVYEAALNTNGVRGMGLGKSAAAITKNILGQDKNTRGVRLTFDEEIGYTIDVYLIVTFGTNIPETAWNVQKSVHDGLLKEFGIEPEDINIHIQGVGLD